MAEFFFLMQTLATKFLRDMMGIGLRQLFPGTLSG
jgi:hypothetical protein